MKIVFFSEIKWHYLRTRKQQLVRRFPAEWKILFLEPYAAGRANSFRRADPYFQWDVVVAEYAEILRDSYWAEDSSLDNVYEEAQWVSEHLYRDEDVREFVELVRTARRLMD